jgi:hypothetical protein
MAYSAYLPYIYHSILNNINELTFNAFSELPNIVLTLERDCPLHETSQLQDQNVRNALMMRAH